MHDRKNLNQRFSVPSRACSTFPSFLSFSPFLFEGTMQLSSYLFLPFCLTSTKQVRPCLGELQLRPQNRLLLEPSQMLFSARAPTLEHLGAPGIVLTGADRARRSQEIVAPSGSHGSSMPFASLAPRWGSLGRGP